MGKSALAGLSAVLIPALALAQGAASLPGTQPGKAPADLPRQSTAAAVLTPAPAPSSEHPDLPLPVYTPRYPYGTVAAADAGAAAERIGTLAQAIGHAYQTNPRLLAERANVRSADFRFPAARAAYGPQVDASAGYAFTRDRTELIAGTFVPAQGFTSTAGLIATLPLFTFGRNAAAVSDATAQIAFRRDVLRITEGEALLGVVTAYVGVLRDAGAVSIARANLALLERQLGDSSERFRIREITSTDVQQVETRVELGRAQLLVALSQLGSSQADFLRVVGLPPGELAPPEVLSLPVASLAEAYATGDAESPVVRAAQSREKVSRAGVEAAKASFRPQVGLRGTADYGSVSDYNDNRRTTRLRGEVTVTTPLIDSGLRSAQLGQAREANEADWRLIESAQRDTRGAIANAWSDLAAARASLDRYRLATDAAQRAYEGALLQEKAGARTTLDTLDLARDLLTVRNNYNVALANEYLARATLLSAMGRLEAPLLVPGTPAYDPAAHFGRVAHRGDIPLLTGALAALDGIVAGDTARDRPNTDPAAGIATDALVPLSRSEAASPP